MIDICNHINLYDITLEDNGAPFAISWQFEENGLEAIELLKPNYDSCKDFEIRLHYDKDYCSEHHSKRYIIVSNHLLIDVATM